MKRCFRGAGYSLLGTVLLGPKAVFMWTSVKMLGFKGQWSEACGFEKFQEVSPEMIIVTDTV